MRKQFVLCYSHFIKEILINICCGNLEKLNRIFLETHNRIAIRQAFRRVKI
nr:MAG TPA: hypothetical protein [Caudoviricetes sp.]